MKRLFVSGLGLLALVTSASAADLGRRGPVPYQAPALVSGYNWTGFYLGINGGGAWARSSWDGTAINTSPSGGMIGITAGYNWQGMGSPWVFGVEGDIDWTNIRGSTTCAVGVVCETRNNWFGTFRGRVGYAFDRVMPYVTGGLAVGDIRANVTGFPGLNQTNAGWTIGGGAEAALGGRWTAKLEYLYADIGSTACTVASCGVATNVDLRSHILRGGVNFRF